jgi:hypothetical protein
MTDGTTDPDEITLHDDSAYHNITISGENGPLVVINTSTGEIEYGEHYTPDAAAKVFWEAIGSLGFQSASQVNLTAENERLEQRNGDLAWLLTEVITDHSEKAPEALAAWLKDWEKRVRAELAKTRKTIDELIEDSSFGTPEAQALRAKTPPEVTDEIMGKLRENERKKVAEYDRALSQSIELKAELRKVAIMSQDGGLTWHCLCCTGSWESDALEEHEGECLAKLSFGTDTVEWNDGEKPIDISIRHPYLFLVWPAEDLPGEWVADCPGINAVSQGGSPDEAFRSLMGQDPEDRAFILPDIQNMLDDIKNREREADAKKNQLHLNIVPKKDDE